MVSLRPSTRNELVIFDAMDRQDHASNFITQIGFKAHQNFFDEPNITYLSVENGNGELSGYFVLVIEPDNESLEFRRILIDRARRGVGQDAIKEMEIYGKRNFDIKRIWLDVYEDNVVGRHIYEKLGYQKFKEGLLEERKLLFYEKTL